MTTLWSFAHNLANQTNWIVLLGQISLSAQWKRDLCMRLSLAALFVVDVTDLVWTDSGPDWVNNSVAALFFVNVTDLVVDWLTAWLNGWLS